MVFTEAEYRKIWLKNRRLAILHSEQYIVQYKIQNGEGYWSIRSLLYYAASKNSHRRVKAKWRKDYPSEQLVSITYQ